MGFEACFWGSKSQSQWLLWDEKDAIGGRRSSSAPDQVIRGEQYVAVRRRIAAHEGTVMARALRKDASCPEALHYEESLNPARVACRRRVSAVSCWIRIIAPPQRGQVNNPETTDTPFAMSGRRNPTSA